MRHERVEYMNREELHLSLNIDKTRIYNTQILLCQIFFLFIFGCLTLCHERLYKLERWHTLKLC